MKHDLRSALLRALGLAFVLEVILVPAILYWPEFKELMPKLKQLAPTPILDKLLGEIQHGGSVAYVLAQHFFKGCNTLGCAGAVLFAMGAVAGEAQRGTLEIWLARPLSRQRLLLERYLLGAFALVFPVFVTTATIPALGLRVGERFDAAGLAWCAAYQALFLLAIYSLTFLLSTLGRHPARIAMIVLFGSILQFALYMVEKATHWSLFRMVDVPHFMKTYYAHELAPRQALPLALFSLAALAASLAAISRRVP